MIAISIHDNHLLSYTVDSEKHEIVLRTVSREHEPPEYANILFSGVIAYDFKFDSFGTILFEVSESSPADIFRKNQSLFKEGKLRSWPIFLRYDSDADFEKYLLDNHIKGFFLSSSCGMEGWIMANSVGVRACGLTG